MVNRGGPALGSDIHAFRRMCAVFRTWQPALVHQVSCETGDDRVVHNAYRITLQGESLRKTNDTPAQPPSGDDI